MSATSPRTFRSFQSRLRRALVQHWRLGILAVCAGGLFRVVSYHLVWEPLRAPNQVRIGTAFETLRPLTATAARIGYISDLPLDTNPATARISDWGDVKYAQAQYVLAPTILAHEGKNSSLLLANFENPARLDDLIASGGYDVLARPGPSVALLRRR